MSEKPWTEAHRREALRRTHEIAAEVSPEAPANAERLALCAHAWTVNEKKWRSLLRMPGHAGLDPARIDREVRRVRGLAEGRLVREPARWALRFRDGARIERPTREGIDRVHDDYTGGVIVRITRIRKASAT